ncbi:arginase [Paenibacillus sp. R14(2021)]|uniref:arginase n=1 Tax=Paenibacillus sp. R14(2021) TaxID=2859228 RepID=UPI001C6139ED|nr:arginase [Paenibacillus sp. R14(2021)]
MNAVNNKNISIIGVPLHYGADREGVDMGPGGIRGANLHERLSVLGYQLSDLGDLSVSRSLQPAKPGEKLKYLDEIVKVNRQLCDTVAEEMSKGQFPLVLGGDHSIAIGTIKGVLQHVKRLGVIWFDAHTDVNTEQTTGSGNIHGMSLAAPLGFGHQDLTSIGGAETKLLPENVVIIGARSIDPGERAFLKEKGIRVFTMHDIDRNGMKQVMEEAMDIVTNGTDGVHLSLDLDGMDPGDAPGVGTPVSGGMSYRECHFAMELLFERDILVSAEIVELNPVLDQHNKTANTAVELIGSVFGERIL